MIENQKKTYSKHPSAMSGYSPEAANWSGVPCLCGNIVFFSCRIPAFNLKPVSVTLPSQIDPLSSVT